MTVILIALIVFGAVFVVGYPLANAGRYEYAENGLEGNETLAHLASARNSTFDAIRDLEFDHATGKLSDEDYRQMRARYDVRAADILQKMDALAGLKQAGSNGTRTRPAGSSALKSGAAQKQTAARDVCPRCKRHLHPGDRFCPTCGARLS